MFAGDFVSPRKLWSRIGTAHAPVIARPLSTASDGDHGPIGHGVVVYDVGESGLTG
jgi:hypothetical protein